MPSGGARKGAGKPKGHKLTKERKTFLQEKRDVEKAYQKSVMKLAGKLLKHQAQLAQGCSYLYRIDKDAKGNKKKPELVTSTTEIEDHPVGNVDDPEAYYYITTERPDNRAIDSMMDRTFGKATQKIEHAGEDGGAIKITGINMVVPNGKSDAETDS
ncbi:hypothetical protein KAR91_75770 [Candidatus Pacearchaeota archaeon]|nr:hypothetical protein [Candidatus Pacearchaeota archaeon]